MAQVKLQPKFPEATGVAKQLLADVPPERLGLALWAGEVGQVS